MFCFFVILVMDWESYWKLINGLKGVTRERASEGPRRRRGLSSAPRGFAARSHILARLALLAQRGELARRLLSSLPQHFIHP